jgi:hypothetical protein
MGARSLDAASAATYWPITPYKEEFFSEEKNQKTFAPAPAETFAAKFNIILLVL